jgi:nitrate reductase NapAB chaperone NapD
MNYSGIVITLAAKTLDETLGRIGAMKGVEIHQIDRPTQRAVAVIEAPDTQAEADIFNKIRAAEGVIDVSLINHYIGDGSEH